MTDYYPLIARAVAGLEKNTGEARRTLYERARAALVAQLRSLSPPLTESEITRERLGLEEAIRKVEAEAARRPRVEAPRRDSIAAVRPGESVPREEAAKEPEPPTRMPGGDEAAVVVEPEEAPVELAPPAPPDEVVVPRSIARARPRPERAAPATEKGLKGLRDVVAEAETLGEATAQAAKSAREAYAAVPANVPELDRVEPRVEPRGLRTPAREPGTREPGTREPGTREPGTRAARLAARQEAGLDSDELFPGSFEERPPPPRPLQSRGEEEAADREVRSRSKGLIAAAIAVLVIVALGAALYWQRDRIKAWLVRNPAVQTQQDTNQPQTQTKIPDRVGQSGTAAQTGQAAGPSGVTAAVAQRVVLYEEDPSNAEGKRYVGSVIWKTETVSPGPGQPPELAIHADLEIPERRLTMTMSVRRNTDKALPASHTIELVFNLPADFPFGGIANVPGILMKQAEQTRGAPLAGLAVKVTSGFFLVGLSSGEADMQRNLQLLKERPWFDIPIVYSNGRRAILAVEKGTPGERAFADAFAAWGQ